MLSNISIEPFRGDLEGLQAMAHYSWRDEYGIDSFPDFYRPAFLRFLFDRIEDKRLLIAAYQGDQIVSFLANLPQRFIVRGNSRSAVYSCLMVTRKELLRKGLGQAVIEEALKINKMGKYDFALLTLETGHRSTYMIEKLKAAGSPVEQVKKNYVIARVLDLERICSSENLKKWETAALKTLRMHRPPRTKAGIRLREYQPDDLDACLGLLNRYQETADLALVWEREKLGIELNYPDVSQTLVFEREGELKGMINFIYHDHLGKTKERWAWINHVAYPELSKRERYGFVQAFLQYAREKDCIGVIEWTRKYYPMGPLYRSRFFPYFRAVNLVSWTFNTEVSLGGIPKVYEIQI